MSDFQLATQVDVQSVTIDGNDVIGLFQKLAVYENIYSPIVTGSIILLDADSADFIGEYDIEGNEEFEFQARSSKGELEIKGYLNGLRNKSVDDSKTLYTFDFTTEPMRKNEQKFITKRFKNESPKDIISEMIEEIGGKEDKTSGTGEPMNFLGCRKRPTEIIKYVMTHGVEKKEGGGNDEDINHEEENKGLTGFLCWETLKGYRFCSTDKMLKGEGGNDGGEFEYKMLSIGESVGEAENAILSYDFRQIGDIQAKLRAGGFKNVVVSYDIDKGIYKEFKYDQADEVATQKQQEASEEPTRYIVRHYRNENFEEGDSKAQKDKYDQSRQYLAQNAVRQNTAPDQSGSFTLPPQFDVNAGDQIDVKIAKVDAGKGGGYNKKHSGKYVVKQVGHHIFNDGKGYTKLTTIRSTTQQDESAS